MATDPSQQSPDAPAPTDGAHLRDIPDLARAHGVDPDTGLHPDTINTGFCIYMASHTDSTPPVVA